MPNLGPMEIAIIALVILVLFGGAKLAGLGKSTGRALREFKDETKGLRGEDEKVTDNPSPDEIAGVTAKDSTETVDAEVVESKRRTEA